MIIAGRPTVVSSTALYLPLVMLHVDNLDFACSPKELSNVKCIKTYGIFCETYNILQVLYVHKL